MDHADDPQTPEGGDAPGVRQLVHAATGDREAEAEALAERAEDVDEAQAREAVGRAHGDIAGDVIEDHDVATVDDAREIDPR